MEVLASSTGRFLPFRLCARFAMPPDPSAEAHERFDELVGGLDYSMFIVTAAAAGRRAGCLVGFATQTSIDPPRFLVCVSEKNHTCRVAREAKALAVHVVPETAAELVELFGGETGDELDKFARCRWSAGPFGLPLLDECGNRFVGRVLERLDLGDHRGFLLEPVAAQMATPRADFRFQRARRVDPGHPA
jgi:flavin reductase (DIM6/NTAB) family NADH-FMN oxidoreductase RutF